MLQRRVWGDWQAVAHKCTCRLADTATFASDVTVVGSAWYGASRILNLSGINYKGIKSAVVSCATLLAEDPYSLD